MPLTERLFLLRDTRLVLANLLNQFDLILPVVLPVDDVVVGLARLQPLEHRFVVVQDPVVLLGPPLSVQRVVSEVEVGPPAALSVEVLLCAAILFNVFILDGRVSCPVRLSRALLLGFEGVFELRYRVLVHT